MSILFGTRRHAGTAADTLHRVDDRVQRWWLGHAGGNRLFGCLDSRFLTLPAPTQVPGKHQDRRYYINSEEKRAHPVIPKKSCDPAV
jgi:hypothetical protein